MLEMDSHSHHRYQIRKEGEIGRQMEIEKLERWPSIYLFS
jgi:hypothetical protein